MSNRKCPDCGERLSIDALRCACGWGAKKRDQGAKFFDYRCTFTAGSERCLFPVGMFPEGATSGWCLFHRQSKGRDGAEIVQQSKTVAYTDAIAAILKRNASAPAVVGTAWDIALKHGNRPWQSGPTFADAVVGKRAA